MALIKGTTWHLFIQKSSLESLGMGLSAARVIILQKDSFSGICRGSFVCLFLPERVRKCAIMNKLCRRSYSTTSKSDVIIFSSERSAKKICFECILTQSYVRRGNNRIIHI